MNFKLSLQFGSQASSGGMDSSHLCSFESSAATSINVRFGSGMFALFGRLRLLTTYFSYVSGMYNVESYPRLFSGLRQEWQPILSAY